MNGFSELAEMEPGLGRIVKAADAMRAGGMDEIEIWWMTKPILENFIGWHRRGGGPEVLKSSRSWDIAVDRIVFGRTERPRPEQLDTDAPWA